jgi:hypothetical protein
MPGINTPPPLTQPHPELSRPPASTNNVWIPPDQWASTQEQLRTLKEWKDQNDQILEMKENERLRIMAEKGQVEEAFKQVNLINERKMSEMRTQLEQRERSWLEEKRTQAINEVMAGRQFIGKDDEARTRTAAMVRKLLELEVEAIIGPSGAPLVRDRVTLRPAADYLRERLTAPESEFAALLAPNKPGGGSGTDGTRPPATPTTAPQAPMSPEETIRAWQASATTPAIGLFAQQKKA